MALRNLEPRSDDPKVERLRRKRDQAWEMAGLASQDGDIKDCERRMAEATDYSRKLHELGYNG